LKYLYSWFSLFCSASLEAKKNKPKGKNQQIKQKKSRKKKETKKVKNSTNQKQRKKKTVTRG